MTNKILWDRWHDPLRPMVERGRPATPSEDEHDPDFRRARSTWGEEGDENPYDDGLSRGSAGPCVMGPFGVVPMFESNLPSKLFNFWMGHTNFRITPEVARVVEAVDGVESIDVFSPYRLRIGVGRAFDEQKVKLDIERAVQPPAQPPAKPAEGPDPLARIKAMLARAHKHWAIAVNPDGTHHPVGGETVEEVKNKLARFGGARVVASWEV